MIHHLQLEVDYSFHSLGISCHVKEYKMAWLLNKCLNTRLEFIDPIVVQHKSGESIHSIYQFVDDEERVCISLISNRSKKGYLLPEFPQTDFILKIEEALFPFNFLFAQKAATTVPKIMMKKALSD